MSGNRLQMGSSKARAALILLHYLKDKEETPLGGVLLGRATRPILNVELRGPAEQEPHDADPARLKLRTGPPPAVKDGHFFRQLCPWSVSRDDKGGSPGGVVHEGREPVLILGVHLGVSQDHGNAQGCQDRLRRMIQIKRKISGPNCNHITAQVIRSVSHKTAEI
jgi:hypothetical protein